MSIILGNGDALKDLHIGNKIINKVVVGNKVVLNLKKQIINHRLIYYLGNEFTNVEGTDEQKYAISTGGWSITKTFQSTSANFYIFNTMEPINTNGYSKIFVRVRCYNIINLQYRLGTDINNQTSGPGFSNLIISTGNMTNNTSVSLIGNLTEFDKQICFSTVMKSAGPAYRVSFGKDSNRLRCGASPEAGTYTYCICLTKSDDISGLSNYGSDIATILSNVVSLFQDTTALNWMVLNCTGDFMISALANSNFVTAMNASLNKAILLENEYWNRFIQLLSV